MQRIRRSGLRDRELTDVAYQCWLE